MIVPGNMDNPKTQLILDQIHNSKNLNKVIILVDSDKRKETIDLIPFSDFYYTVDNSSPKAYICKNYTCDLPTDDLVKIKEQLEK